MLLEYVNTNKQLSMLPIFSKNMHYYDQTAMNNNNIY